MTVIEEIAVERYRQVVEEGWTPDHDDTHHNDELARAAACYAVPFALHRAGPPKGISLTILPVWPWADYEPKRKERRRDLVRAAALLVAEIERLDRSAGR